MTAGSHVSIPKPFSSGDVVEWFQRFDLCSDANKWEEEVKAVKMPTLLEGEALAAWLDLAEETKKDYETAKKQLIDGLMPIAFTLLDKFYARKLLPGESLTVFSHDLRKLIVRAMPEIDSKARDQLLLHQFIACRTAVEGEQRAARCRGNEGAWCNAPTRTALIVFGGSTSTNSGRTVRIVDETTE